MKKQDFLRSLENVDPDLVVQASPAAKKPKTHLLRRVGLIAACFLLVAGMVGGAVAWSMKGNKVPTDQKTYGTTTEEPLENQKEQSVPTQSETSEPSEISETEKRAGETSDEVSEEKKRETNIEEPVDPSEYPAGSGLTLQLLKSSTIEKGQREALKEEFIEGYLQFALDFLKDADAKSEDGTVLSPLSAVTALSIAANGAKNETLSQMLEVLTGGKLDMNGLNRMLEAYYAGLPSSEKAKLTYANAMFLSSDPSFHVNKQFLDTVGQFYEADLFEANFHDPEPVAKKINDWCAEKTDGKITDLIDPDAIRDAVNVILNAVSFDAEWMSPAASYDVSDRVFHGKDGDTTVPMMKTDGYYLEGENEIGFLKKYSGGQYAFVGLLPKEETMPLGEYLAGLTPKHWNELLNVAWEDADVFLPLFKQNSEADLVEFLQESGMTDAFDSGKADFSGTGYSDVGNLYISSIKQKAMIEVNTKGTSAAAVTAIMEDADSCSMHFVLCDRPFVYAIIDVSTGLPLFIGTCENIA